MLYRRACNTLIMIFLSFHLQGCAGALLSTALIGTPSAMLAKFGLASKPEMYYKIKGKEIVLNISTYSSNISSVKNMAEVAAAMIAKKELGCNYIALTYAKWPNSLIDAAIKIETVVTYDCVSNTDAKNSGAATLFGTIVDVNKKLLYEQDLVSIIRTHQLLKKKGELVTDYSDIEESHVDTETITHHSRPSKNKLTLAIQKKLIELGYHPGIADGVMGRNTQSALKKFQRDKGLQVTGKGDYDTMVALGIVQ